MRNIAKPEVGLYSNQQLVDILSDLLVGEFCYGDDGENAEITAVYLDNDNHILFDIRQDDGIDYIGFRLDYYMDAIETDEETMQRVTSILAQFD